MGPNGGQEDDVQATSVPHGGACTRPARATGALSKDAAACAPARAACTLDPEAPLPLAPPASPPSPVVGRPAAPAATGARPVLADVPPDDATDASFARPGLGSWVAAHARAGILGGAAGSLFFVFFWLLAIARVARWLEGAPAAFAALALTVAWIVGLRFGFRSRSNGLRARVLRGLGLTPFAIAAGLGALLAAVLVDQATHIQERSAALVMAGAALAEIALARAIRASAGSRAPAVARRSEDRRVAPLFWSGLLASSLGMAAFGAIDTLHREDAVDLSSSARALAMTALACAAFVLAIARGQGAETRARISLGRRFTGTFFFGLLTAPALLLVAAGCGAAFDVSSSALGRVLFLVGVGVALAAGARGRGLLGVPRRDLFESSVFAAALVLSVGYVESAWVRYALGSGSAADALAREERAHGDLERAVAYFRVACDRGVDAACAVASDMVERGQGVAPDAQLAARLRRLACDDPASCMDLADRDPAAREPLRRRACELGDPVACARAALALLQDGCDARDVFACRDLATRLDRQQQGAGFRAWRSACALGDAAACAQVGR